MEIKNNPGKIRIIRGGYELPIFHHEVKDIERLKEKIEKIEDDLERVEAHLYGLEGRLKIFPELNDENQKFLEGKNFLKDTKWLIEKYTKQKEQLENELENSKRELEHYEMIAKFIDKENKMFNKKVKEDYEKYIQENEDEPINIEKFYVSPEKENE